MQRKIKNKRVLKNGAIAGYVLQKDGSWKWRIVKGPKKNYKRGGNPLGNGNQFMKIYNVTKNRRSNNTGSKNIKKTNLHNLNRKIRFCRNIRTDEVPENFLDKIIPFSNKLFRNEHKKMYPNEPFSTKYKPAEWYNRYNGLPGKSLGNGVIIASHNHSGVKSYIVAYEVDNSIFPGLGPGIYLHSWMGGTDVRCRGRGLMRKCFELVEKVARDRGLRGVTLNTNVVDYPAMFRLATTWWNLEVYKQIGNKVFLKKEF